jgi:hypothetical protein
MTLLRCLLFYPLEQTLRILPIYARISPTNSSLLPTNIPSSDPSLLSLSSDNSTSDSTLPPDLDEDAFSFPSSLTLLSPARLADLEAKFRREADALFVEAKRSVVSQRAMIPVWVYGALVVLGWNEFLAVVTNPLYFTSLLVLAVGAFLTQRFGMSGPLLQVVGTVWAEVSRRIDLFPASSDPAPQLLTSFSSFDRSTVKSLPRCVKRSRPRSSIESRATALASVCLRRRVAVG